jgi:hypothetical protein
MKFGKEHKDNYFYIVRKLFDMKHIIKLLKLIKAYFILLISGWHTLDLTPPNKRV